MKAVENPQLSWHAPACAVGHSVILGVKRWPAPDAQAALPARSRGAVARSSWRRSPATLPGRQLRREQLHVRVTVSIDGR